MPRCRAFGGSSSSSTSRCARAARSSTSVMAMERSSIRRRAGMEVFGIDLHEEFGITGGLWLANSLRSGRSSTSIEHFPQSTTSSGWMPGTHPLDPRPAEPAAVGTDQVATLQAGRAPALFFAGKPGPSGRWVGHAAESLKDTPRMPSKASSPSRAVSMITSTRRSMAGRLAADTPQQWNFRLLPGAYTFRIGIHTAPPGTVLHYVHRGLRQISHAGDLRHASRDAMVRSPYGGTPCRAIERARRNRPVDGLALIFFLGAGTT